MVKTLFSLLVLFVAIVPSQGAPLPDLAKAKRIVFLGDSITYGGHYVSCVEGWLTMKHPQRGRVVLNLGLSSETVSGLSEKGHAGGRFPRPDLHERLGRVLAGTKPDLVFACYGMNCGIYQAADEERFAAFKSGIVKLREAVAQQGGTVVHITPWAYDHATGRTGTKDYNTAVLGRYAQWLLEKRQDGWHVIDLHGPMSAEIRKRQAENAKFTFQRDGVHPNKAGHWFAAQQIIRACGDEASAGAADGPAMMGQFQGGAKVLPLVEQRMALLRDAWLSETRHLRPGVRAGLPVKEATEKAERIANEIDQLRGGGDEK